MEMKSRFCHLSVRSRFCTYLVFRPSVKYPHSTLQWRTGSGSAFPQRVGPTGCRHTLSLYSLTSPGTVLKMSRIRDLWLGCETWGSFRGLEEVGGKGEAADHLLVADLQIEQAQ